MPRGARKNWQPAITNRQPPLPVKNDSSLLTVSGPLKGTLVHYGTKANALLIHFATITQIWIGMVRLRELQLSQNKIYSVLPKAFKGLLNIRVIDISENLIKSLNSDVFHPNNFQARLVPWNEIQRVKCYADYKDTTWYKNEKWNDVSLCSIGACEKIMLLDETRVNYTIRPLLCRINFQIHDNPIICNKLLCTVWKLFENNKTTFDQAPTCKNGIQWENMSDICQPGIDLSTWNMVTPNTTTTRRYYNTISSLRNNHDNGLSASETRIIIYVTVVLSVASIIGFGVKIRSRRQERMERSRKQERDARINQAIAECNM